jgi:transposase
MPLPKPSGGQKRVITWKMEQAVKALLDERPWLYLDEIKDFLLDMFDVDVDLSTVSRTIKRIKITRKKLRVEAAQRNPELRTQWQDNLQFFTAEQLVCVDESGSDDRTGDRSYGWASNGSRATVSRWLENKIRVSVLPAYTIDGYIAARTFEGSGTGDIFEDFIVEDLLPLCNPYPGPKSVIVLDNASIHHSNIYRIKRACHAVGVWLRFLPPYSPDFNPIEESFNDLKAYIRRHYRRERRHYRTYQDFLEWAVRKVGRGAEARRARGHFRHAGIQGVPAN